MLMSALQGLAEQVHIIQEKVCSGRSACNTTLMATVSSLYRDAVEG